MELFRTMAEMILKQFYFRCNHQTMAFSLAVTYLFMSIIVHQSFWSVDVTCGAGIVNYSLQLLALLLITLNLSLGS